MRISDWSSDVCSSDLLANVQTRAELQADGSWRVSGQKIWTSLAHESNWLFVLARSTPRTKGNKGLIFLLLPLDQPGIEIRPIRQMSGGAEFKEVFFDTTVAAPEHVGGKPAQAWKVTMDLIEAARGLP